MLTSGGRDLERRRPAPGLWRGVRRRCAKSVVATSAATSYSTSTSLRTSRSDERSRSRFQIVVPTASRPKYSPVSRLRITVSPSRSRDTTSGATISRSSSVRRGAISGVSLERSQRRVIGVVWRAFTNPRCASSAPVDRTPMCIGTTTPRRAASHWTASVRVRQVLAGPSRRPDAAAAHVRCDRSSASAAGARASRIVLASTALPPGTAGFAARRHPDL